MSATAMHPGQGDEPSHSVEAGAQSDAFVTYLLATFRVSGGGPYLGRGWIIPGPGIAIVVGATALVAACLIFQGHVPAHAVALATFVILALCKSLDSALFAIWLSNIRRLLPEGAPAFAFMRLPAGAHPGAKRLDRRASDVLALALLVAGIWLFATL